MTRLDEEVRCPIRVMQLLLWITPVGGGIQSYLRSMLDAFAGAPDVRHLGVAVGAGETPSGFTGPVTFGAPGRSPWRNAFRFLRNLMRTAREADLAQIHGIYGPQFIVGGLGCWVLGVPYIVNPHNALAPAMLAQKPLRKRLFFATLGGFILNRAACVLGTSPPEAEFLTRRFPRARVKLILPAIPVAEAPTVEMLREPVEGELRVLYLGSFDPWKRVPLLIQVIGRLHREGLRVQLTIAGDGPAALRGPAEQAASEIAPGLVRFAGFVQASEKLQLIRRSHVLVLPATTDSYSMATAEALAEGLPVVVTEGAGAAPHLRAHACGTVVPVDDAQELARAIREYANATLRQERALNAHRYARAELAPPALRARMSALYRELARA